MKSWLFVWKLMGRNELVRIWKRTKLTLNTTGTESRGVKLILGVMQINQAMKYFGSCMIRDCFWYILSVVRSHWNFTHEVHSNQIYVSKFILATWGKCIDLSQKRGVCQSNQSKTWQAEVEKLLYIKDHNPLCLGNIKDSKRFIEGQQYGERKPKHWIYEMMAMLINVAAEIIT